MNSQLSATMRHQIRNTIGPLAAKNIRKYQQPSSPVSATKKSGNVPEPHSDRNPHLAHVGPIPKPVGQGQRNCLGWRAAEPGCCGDSIRRI